MSEKTTGNLNFVKDKFYIIRAEKSGLFMGIIDFIDNNVVGIRSLRRLFYWSGALDGTQIAKCGVSRPQNCKFSEQLSYEDVSLIKNWIEFHPMTDEAIKSINNVPVWKQK